MTNTLHRPWSDAELRTYLKGYTDMATKTIGNKGRQNTVKPRPGNLDTETCAGVITPVGIAEVAERMNVPRESVEKRRQRSKVYRTSEQPEWAFPEPRWTVGGRPAWEWTLDIMPWVEATGRNHYLEGKDRA